MNEKAIDDINLKENEKKYENEKWDVDCILETGDFDKTLITSLMKGFLKIMILWIITKKRIHGYEIIKKMKEEDECNKEHNFDFEGPGSNKIYPILHELEKKKLIIGDWELQGKRKVKYYEATNKGINTIEIIRKKPHKNVPPIIREFWMDVMVRSGKDFMTNQEINKKAAD